MKTFPAYGRCFGIGHLRDWHDGVPGAMGLPLRTSEKSSSSPISGKISAAGWTSKTVIGIKFKFDPADPDWRKKANNEIIIKLIDKLSE